MDLTEITQRWNESTAFMASGATAGVASFSSGKVFYNYTNIFVQMPTQMCPGTEEKPDTNIQVRVSNPQSNATIHNQFSVSYSIAAPKNIRRVVVMLNKQQVGAFDYPSGNTKSVSDTKQVTITGTGFKNNEYTLDVVAFDFAGFSNRVSIPVTLSLSETVGPAAADTAAPTIDTANLRVSKNADGSYSIVIPLKDVTAVVTGKVTRNGQQLYEFKNSISTADFQIDALGPVVVTAADPAGNQLNQTIDLNTYYHQ